MEKFKGKYRIPSIRLQNWNYGWNGAYFITACTKNRIHYFGKVVNGKMQFSHIGIVADILWYEIKNHADRIELGEFVVMPNHIHGILILNNKNCDRNFNNNDNQCSRDKACLVSTTTTTDNDQTIGQKRFQNQGKNTISSIVGGYKSAVTKHVKRLGYQFTWQSRFHDYIIRNDVEFDRIVKYIQNNPQNWHRDKFCDS
ncbi:MAG: transposase [Cyanobacteria bacterium P01_G01_bin.67]